MHMATATLAGPASGDVVDAALLAALLRATAEEHSGLEHLTVVPRPGRTDVVLFYTGTSPCAADAAGTDLCRRALRAAAELGRWNLCQDG